MRWVAMAFLLLSGCVDDPVPVMALGDSITLGSPSYVPAESYRVKALEGVESQGFSVAWVGPEKHVSQEHYHNGVSGKFIYQIRANFTASAATYDPRVVVACAGTNDLFYPGNDADKNETAMRLLVADVLGHASVEHLLLLALPGQPAKPAETVATNARYALIASEFETVTYVPLKSIEMTDTAPEVEHPTVVGYQEMGRQLAPYLARVIRSLP